MGLVFSLSGASDFHVGDAALSASDDVDFKLAIESGIVVDWDEMETIWNEAFAFVLEADSMERSVVLTESPINPPEDREKTVRTMFETYLVREL